MIKPFRGYQNNAYDAVLNSKGNVVLDIATGGGKSLLVAKLMQNEADHGRKVVCLTMTRELTEQNKEEYTSQGYTDCAVYCAALRKQWGKPCLFASPQSLIRVLENSDHYLTKTPVDMIIIDECHNVNDQKENSVYMKIIRHYLTLNPALRVVGLTGTPFRDGSNPIVGNERLFKKVVYQVGTQELIEKKFLVNPVYVNHESEDIHVKGFDFSDCTADSLGNFREEDLTRVIKKDMRLTGRIMVEVERKTRNRGGVFIFASTIRHCDECLEALPKGSAAIVTGKTPSFERYKIMKDAKAGKVKFLINVGVLTTGINLPAFDCVVFVRPTSSRVLYLQAIGRSLRLSEGKSDALVLDYANNYGEHGSHNKPPLTKNIKEIDPAEELLPCPECEHLNKLTARRCAGDILGDRCEFYFQGKECPQCQKTNDITARYCTFCKLEMVNPNDKLGLNDYARTKMTVNIKSTEFTVIQNRKKLRIIYTATDNTVFCEDVPPEEFGRVICGLFGLKRRREIHNPMDAVKASQKMKPVRQLKMYADKNGTRILRRIR